MLGDTNLTSTEQSFTQLPLFGYNADCEAGLHSYYNSKEYNADGQPICKYCGADINDWKRMHRRDIKDVAYTVSQLKTEKFRLEWWSKELDQGAKNHALRKGLLNMREAVFTRLRKSIGEVHEMPDGTFRPYRDGFQTPYIGNSIYYAQHALACCCRKCLRYWYGVPNGRSLSNQELEYFTELVMHYIRLKLPEMEETGQIIPKGKS